VPGSTLRSLRSGKLYTVSLDKLTPNSKVTAARAYWRKDKIYKNDKLDGKCSILIDRGGVRREMTIKNKDICKINHSESKHEWNLSDRAERSKNYDKNRYNFESSFKSSEEGTLIIKLRNKESISRKHVKFKEITVHFY